jgi:diguanylate cyclase (GGDEF)-like protein/PAS domain S-box-containing protein
MTKEIKVLVIDDSDTDAELAIRMLRRGGFEVQHERVESAAATEAAFQRQTWDAVISDFNMPSFTGLDALTIFQSAGLDIPFILISGTIGEETAVAAMKAGASDYVTKENLARIAPALERELQQAAMRAAHRQAARHLVESEDWLRRAQLRAKLAHLITGPGGSFETWSETLPKLIGVDPAEMPRSAREWLRILDPADREIFREKSNEASVKNTRVDLEYRLRRADGAWIQIRQATEPLPRQADADGKMRWFNTLQDVTEQKRAEEALRESESLKGAIIESSLDCLIAIDHQGNIVEFNPAAEVTFGIPRELALGKPMAEMIIPPRLRDAHHRGFAHYLATGEGPVLGKRLELEAMRVDGTEFPIELALTAIKSRSAPLFTGFIRDITARKEAEAKIVRLNRVYAVLSEINSAIVRIRDRQPLFEEACRIAVEHGNFQIAWIGEYDRATLDVTPVAWKGMDGNVASMKASARTDIPQGQGIVGRAIREKKPVITGDINADPTACGSRREEALQRGLQSIIAMPLMVDGEVTATLTLFAREKNFFSEDELRLLTQLAADISFGLNHIEKEERIEYLAYYDSLTGLANRTLFHERLVQYVGEAHGDKGRLAVFILDADRFKTINDTFGRQAGDELLRQIAERVARYASPIRMARISADRFAIVRSDVSSEIEVAQLIEQWLEECFGPPFVVSGTELRVSAKAGIALFPNDGTDADALFRNAEAALKKAKATRERYLFHTQQMTEKVGEQLRLETQLRQALEREELVLHYQPKVDTRTRRIVGVEALIRWHSPEVGLVPPMTFIPLLEETGLILEVGVWAMRRAVLDHRDWKDRGLRAPRIAVNVSAVQLRKYDFVATVGEVIKLGSVQPGIDLEITESVVMLDIEAIIGKLEAIRLLGVSIAIDDFGTGYSSLGYLARLPVQSLKIDRSFIVTMLGNPSVMTLVSTIISLAHSLNLKVVAEGVDAEEQAEVLERLGCDQMQGYLFSKPIPGDQIEKLLARDSQSPWRKAGIRRRRT